MKTKRKRSYHNAPSPIRYMAVATLIVTIVIFAFILIVSIMLMGLTSDPAPPTASEYANTILYALMSTIRFGFIPALVIGILVSQFIQWRIDITLPVSYQQTYTIPFYIFIVLTSAVVIVAIIGLGVVIFLLILICALYALVFASMTHFYLSKLRYWQLEQDSKMKSGQPVPELHSLDPLSDSSIKQE